MVVICSIMFGVYAFFHRSMVCPTDCSMAVMKTVDATAPVASTAGLLALRPPPARAAMATRGRGKERGEGGEERDAGTQSAAESVRAPTAM